MKQKYFNSFLNALLDATENISEGYFQLNVADRNNKSVIFQRERIYCYELYCKIRGFLPNDFPFTLHGEVDKKGHPIIVERCGAINPDFIVHIPGSMKDADNLVIVEVKNIYGANFNKEGKSLLKDIETINCMIKMEEGYFKGIILIFGSENEQKKQEIEMIYRERCDTKNTLLLFHDNAKTKARIL